MQVSVVKLNDIRGVGILRQWTVIYGATTCYMLLSLGQLTWPRIVSTRLPSMSLYRVILLERRLRLTCVLYGN
jgi:hypothetical protein